MKRLALAALCMVGVFALSGCGDNVTLTEEQFKESLNKYIESLEQKRTTTTTKQTTNEGNKFNIFDFIIKYNEYISAFGVLLLIIYIVVDIKITNKKRRSIL